MKRSPYRVKRKIKDEDDRAGWWESHVYDLVSEYRQMLGDLSRPYPPLLEHLLNDLEEVMREDENTTWVKMDYD